MNAGIVFAAATGLLLSVEAVSATPSSTFWTTAQTDVQPTGVWHAGVDCYFTVDKTSASGEQGDFPADFGLTVGLPIWGKLQAEVGVDAMFPSDHPLYLNAKVGLPEGCFGAWSPSVSLGVFNVGFAQGETDYNILHAAAGMTLPLKLGRLFLGGYIGNGNLLVSSDGADESAGFMIGYDRPLIEGRLSIAADYAGGRNAIGGGGIGLCYYCSDKTSILAGPVWFNDAALNGPVKWTVQVDINL